MEAQTTEELLWDWYHSYPDDEDYQHNALAGHSRKIGTDDWTWRFSLGTLCYYAQN